MSVLDDEMAAMTKALEDPEPGFEEPKEDLPVDDPPTDPPADGTPSATVAVDNNLDISTVNVADDSHTHATNPASVTSGNNSGLPPFFVIYAWKRTA